MIHHAKLFVRRLAYTPWLLAAGLVLGWAGAAAAQTPVVKVSSTGAAEGHAMTFEVSLSALPADAVTVDYSLSASTTDHLYPASLTGDLTDVRGTLTFTPGKPGQLVQSVAVQTTDDDADPIDEHEETFMITLSNAQGATLALANKPTRATPTTPAVPPTQPSSIGLGRIFDNDPEPELSVVKAQASEGSNVDFTVALSAKSEKAVTVKYTTAAPSGTTKKEDGKDFAEANDYTPTPSGTLTFSAASDTQLEQTASVPTANDSDDEYDEIFLLKLYNGVNAAIAKSGTDGVTGTILDNDPLPSLALTVDGNVTSVGEGAGSSIIYTVTKTGGTERDITVQYSVAAAPTDKATSLDFTTPMSGTLTIFSINDNVPVPFTVTIRDDNIGEEDEPFTVQLNTPVNAVLGVDAATVTITDDDPVTLSVADAQAAESEPVRFTVTLSAARAQEVTVDWQASLKTGTPPAGEAFADNSDFKDLSAAKGTLTIAAEKKEGTIAIPINDDGLDEVNGETFTLTLSNPAMATGNEMPTLANRTATGTILDNDPPPAFSVADAHATEGQPVEFVVRASAWGLAAMEVDYNITVGGGFTAASPNDFVDSFPLTGTLTFDPKAEDASLTQTVPVATRDDGDDEANENFTLTLVDPPRIADADLSTPTIAVGNAVGTILDNDGAPSLSVANASATEGQPVVFTVTLTLNSTMDRNEAITVEYATSFGTATSDDFTAASGTLTFAADATGAALMQTVDVPTTQDEISEDNETFALTLSNASPNAEIGIGTATGTIKDDDGTPTLSVANATATEGAAVVFTVTLSKVSTEAVTVAYESVIASGNTASPDDLALGADTLTIPAGSTSGAVSVQTTQDAVRERDETFTLRLSNASSNAVIGTGTATGTIKDDDTYVSKGQIALTLTPATVREDAGTTAEVSVTASVASPTDAAVTVALALSGTAKEGTDYTVSGTQSITIAAGATLDKTALTFTPINDDTYEGDETIRITGTATGYTSGSATLTLTDDDRPPPPPPSGGGGGGSPPPPPPPPPSPSFDNKTIAAQFYIQGTAIDALVFPAAQNGTKPLSYALSQTSTAPAAIDPLTGLPDSLAFNPKTRTLTGTPATPLPATEFSYTVIDADGRTASLCFDITIYALIGPPTPPTDLTVAFDAAGRLVLHWKEPARNGGYDLTSYEVQYQKTTSASWRGLAIRVPANHPTKTYIIGGLQADAEYNVRVRAYNLNPLPDLSLGEWAWASTDETAMPDEIAAEAGAPAAAGTVCKPGVGDLLAIGDAGDGEPPGDGDAGEPTVPGELGAPINLTATPGDGKLLLRWEEPAQTGGFDLTFYDLQYQKTTSTSWRSVAIRIPANYHIKTYSIGGLQNGVAYNVRVRVHNLNPDPERSRSAWTTATATPTEDAAAKQVASGPASFELAAAYPNPFNPSTTIGYALPQAADVRLDIYNVMGQRVRTLVAAHQPAGYYAVEWKATDDNGHTLSSGVYFYRLQAGAFGATKRMLLMR